MQNQIAFKCADIGTVSHGTLRHADLLESFACEIQNQVQRNADYFQQDDNFRKERDYILGVSLDALASDPDHPDVDEILQDCIDILNQFAAPYQYFGSHEGDGSDFGFWPDWESIRDEVRFGDLIEVSDPADIPADDGYCVCINDHGNMALYRTDNGVTRIVWECV